MKKVLSAVAFLMFAFTSSHAMADQGWSIDTSKSSLYFVSTKKEHVAERHVIDGISGSLSHSGNLIVDIDTATHTSGVIIRDTRIRDILFRVVDFPKATFVGEIEMQDFQDLEIGETIVALIEGDLTLVGVEGFVEFEVAVTRVKKDRVQVNTLSPVIIDSADYEIDSGIDTLRNLAKLSAISYSVPVTFTLTFDQG